MLHKYGGMIFLKNIKMKTAQCRESNLILFGDFNAVSNLELNKSGPGSAKSAMPIFFLGLAKGKSLVDGWRQNHDPQKNHTFYSGRHNSYSRIDYIFQACSQSVQVLNSNRGSRIYSDCAPVTVEWQIAGHKQRRRLEDK